jgi:hypothetical protein
VWGSGSVCRENSRWGGLVWNTEYWDCLWTWTRSKASKKQGCSMWVDQR